MKNRKMDNRESNNVLSEELTGEPGRPKRKGRKKRAKMLCKPGPELRNES